MVARWRPRSSPARRVLEVVLIEIFARVLWASPLWFREATAGADVSNYDPDKGRVRFEGFESEGASHENVY